MPSGRSVEGGVHGERSLERDEVIRVSRGVVAAEEGGCVVVMGQLRGQQWPLQPHPLLSPLPS